MTLPNILLTDPISLLETHVLEGPLYMKRQSAIWECGCDLSRKRSVLRNSLENEVVTLFKERLMNEEKITIMSLGSGGCFQELVLHAKISAIFKKRIKWILVDKDYTHWTKTLEAFYKLMQTISPNFKIIAYNSAPDAYKKLRKYKPNIILNIDGLDIKVDRFREATFPHIWAALKKEGMDWKTDVAYYNNHSQCRIL